MTKKEKVEMLKKASANGKVYFVMCNYDGFVNGKRRDTGDVISCHNNHLLAEKSPAGRSNLTRICDIGEVLLYLDC